MVYITKEIYFEYIVQQNDLFINLAIIYRLINLPNKSFSLN